MKRLNKGDLESLLKKAEKSPAIRRNLAHESFGLFFEFYFRHYMTAPFASFHRDIFRLTEDADEKFIVIMAFRGSGKSTIVNTALPLWAILGKLQCKFVVIIAQTQTQGKQYMKNLKDEIINNEFLRKDLGPFREEGDEWNASSIVLQNSKARITIASIDQSIRGIRHGRYRPQLVIADDIEDLSSSKSKEGRDRTFDWFTKELIPAGDLNTRYFLIGNMLHRDSLLMRMQERIESGEKSGVFRKYPLLDEDGACLWKERYSEEDITQLKASVGSEVAWRCEYLLEDAGSESQIIKPEWIHFYDELPEASIQKNITTCRNGCSMTYTDPHSIYPIQLITGIDLAISESTTADYTAFVTGWIWIENEKKIIYIVDVFFQRMDFPTTIATLKVYDEVKKNTYKKSHKVYSESVAYQSALEQSVRQSTTVDIHGMTPKGSKADRLILISDLIKRGQVRFARTPNCLALVEQMLGFGHEKHDDLVDALTTMVIASFEYKASSFFIGTF